MSVSGTCPLALPVTFIRLHLVLLLPLKLSPHDFTVSHVTASMTSDRFPGSAMSWVAVVAAWIKHTLPNTFPIAVWLVPLVMFLGIKMLDDLPEPVPKEQAVYTFDYYKNLYRTKRDAFRADVAANEELKHWKAQDNEYKYNEL